MGCFNSIKNLQDDDLNNILSSCGLSNIDISSISTTLSGGESTRVNMARAMASSHKIIIADELLASLDYCVIMTVHNQEYLNLFDKVIDLNNLAT